MSDHALLVPTSAGPVGAVVTEPEGKRHAALALLQGGGDDGRSGVNGVWARTARAVSELGVAVLRADYPGMRESHMVEGGRGVEHFLVLQDVIRWFRKRLGEQDFFIAGSCYGARLAAELASREADVAGLALVAPYLRDSQPRRRTLRGAMGLTARGRVERGRIDPEAIKALGNVLHRAPVWAMVGERDRQDLRMVKQTLGPVGDRLEVHVIPGVALHSFRSSYAQGEALARTLDWVSRMLVRTGAVGRGGVQGPRRLSAYTEEPLR